MAARITDIAFVTDTDAIRYSRKNDTPNNLFKTFSVAISSETLDIRPAFAVPHCFSMVPK